VPVTERKVLEKKKSVSFGLGKTRDYLEIRDSSRSKEGTCERRKAKAPSLSSVSVAIRGEEKTPMRDEEGTTRLQEGALWRERLL